MQSFVVSFPDSKEVANAFHSKVLIIKKPYNHLFFLISRSPVAEFNHITYFIIKSSCTYLIPKEFRKYPPGWQVSWYAWVFLLDFCEVYFRMAESSDYDKHKQLHVLLKIVIFRKEQQATYFLCPSPPIFTSFPKSIIFTACCLFPLCSLGFQIHSPLIKLLFSCVSH